MGVSALDIVYVMGEVGYWRDGYSQDHSLAHLVHLLIAPMLHVLTTTSSSQSGNTH